MTTLVEQLRQNPGAFQNAMQCAVKGVVDAFSTGGCRQGQTCPAVATMQATFNAGIDAGVFKPVKPTWKPVSGPKPKLTVDGLWGRNSAKVASNFVISPSAFGGFYHDAARMTVEYVADRNSQFDALCIRNQGAPSQIARDKRVIVSSPSNDLQTTTMTVIRNTGQFLTTPIVNQTNWQREPSAPTTFAPSATFAPTSFTPVSSPGLTPDWGAKIANERSRATVVNAQLDQLRQQLPLPTFAAPSSAIPSAVPASVSGMGSDQTTMAVIGVTVVALSGLAYWAMNKRR